MLGALHAKGVFHCDVKPDNVVLVQNEHDFTEARSARSLFPVLIDFSTCDDGLITMTVWFASKALLRKERATPEASDDLESLWRYFREGLFF